MTDHTTVAPLFRTPVCRLVLLLLFALGTTALQAEPAAPATEARAAIGWKLFFDTQLSRNNNVSCATCHDPLHAYSDGQRFSTGTHGNLLSRNTPTIINLHSATQFFWDGRASTLEEQAEGPLTHPLEMDMALDEVSARVQSDPDYRKAFAAIGVQQIGIADINGALADYQRSLRSGENAYDRWLQGETDALDKSQSNGRFLFFTRGQCATCHIGTEFTDYRLHNVGTGTLDDPGRYTITGAEEDRGLFKTPSLRNWKGSERFMHDGRFASMEEVIDFYADPPPPEVGKSELDPLRFSARDKRDLLAFMDALNGSWPDLARYEEAWQQLLER